jgi:hypothetical protein
MPKSPVQAAFEKQIVVLPLGIIVPQKEVTKAQREGDFYRHITASLRHVGLIEPLVVYPRGPGDYLLLEGHIRLDILKSLGIPEAKCLLSTDDEAYTYNRHVNYIPGIAQHFMLLEALKNGLTEERIATALDISVESIRMKRDMLNGICPEAVQVLIDKPVSPHVLALLRKMKAIRQIEAAEHMVAGGTYSPGAGVDIDVVKHFLVKVEFDYRMWNFGSNPSAPNSSDFTLTPQMLTVGVRYAIPFRSLKSQSDFR